MDRGVHGRAAPGAMLALALIISPTAIASEGVFLERTALAAAADACSLLDPARRTALEAGRLQARNAVLRAGVSLGDLLRAESEAVRIGQSKSCADKVLADEIARLGEAFKRYQLTARELYRGDSAAWAASRSRVDGWHVVQVLEGKGVRAEYGLRRISREIDAEGVGELSLKLRFDTPRNIIPVAAAVRLRDPELSAEPWLASLVGGRAKPPPQAISFTSQAVRRDIVTRGEAGVSELVFVFSPSLVARMAALHPNERFEVSVATDPRDPSRQLRLTFEAGDFAAAHAFASLPPL